MAEADLYEVGYQKPPERNRFVKGRSGNPKGRPKGSQNLASIIAKVGRERVQVKTNGRVQTMTKLEASTAQLANQAMSGKIPAIREFLQFQRFSEESSQSVAVVTSPGENDQAVMASILKRIRATSDSPSEAVASFVKESASE